MFDVTLGCDISNRLMLRGSRLEIVWINTNYSELVLTSGGSTSVMFLPFDHFSRVEVGYGASFDNCASLGGATHLGGNTRLGD